MKSLGILVVLTLLLSWVALVEVAVGGVAYPDPAGNWDLVFHGDSDAYGTTGDTLTVGTGDWVRQSKNQWDGSAPGEVDPTLTPNPPAIGYAEGDSPGGVVTLTEGSTSYLRVQDTGDPTTVDISGSNNVNGFVPWSDPSNRTLLFGHNIQKEHPGVTLVMSNGITMSFRARLSSTGTLDDIYPDWDDNEVEYPDLQVVTPWPTGGKGYKVSDSAIAMFSVSEDGTKSIGFSLVLDIDTPGSEGGNNGAVIPASSGGGNIGSGLIMNNRPGGGIFNQPGSDRALLNPPDAQGIGANLVPINDSDLLNWHEFWITIENPDFDGDYDVNVYMDGSFTPTTFLVDSSNGVNTNFNESLMFGLGSGTSWAAFDMDFISYKLGVIAPVPEPSALALGLFAAAGLGWMGRRL